MPSNDRAKPDRSTGVGTDGSLTSHHDRPEEQVGVGTDGSLTSHDHHEGHVGVGTDGSLDGSTDDSSPT